MKKYTAIITTKTDTIDDQGCVCALTFAYKADRLRDIYKQAERDTCNYKGIRSAYVYDKQGRVVKWIASIDREIAVGGELDWQERQDAAVLYADHKEDDGIAL